MVSGGPLGAFPNPDAQGKHQLGLTIDPVRILPRYVHRDVFTDDFGPDVPVETLWNMAECNIAMTLVHYDAALLSVCMGSSMGAGTSLLNDVDGAMGPAGRPMGFGRGLGTALCNYITLYLKPAQSTWEPYRFLATYLNSQPLEIPYGTERTLVKLNWRCIPYRELTTAEISSAAGIVLWDHETTNPIND